MVSFYLLFEKWLAKRLKLTETDRRNLITHCIVDGAVMMCGIYVTITASDKIGVGIVAVVFFGLRLLNAIRQYIDR
jgi:hypothetical protein